jgi:hypothetical protein
MTAQGMNRYSHRAEDRLLFLAWDLNQDGHDVSLPILIGLDAYSILAQGSDTNICARQTTCPACLGPLSEGCIPDRRQHDPVTHTIKPPRCSLPYPLDDTPLGPLNKWMYSFRTFQDQQHQQQILSRPTSLLVIGTITVQRSFQLDGELPFQCLSLWAWMAQVTS